MARSGLNISQRKDGRFEGRYKKGYKENGSIYFGYIYGPTYDEVKKRLIPLREKYRKYQVNNSSKYSTLSQWLDYWLPCIIRPNVRESTYQNYLEIIKGHIRPLLGNNHMDKLNKGDIQYFIDTLKSKNLSPAYIYNIYRLLKFCLQGSLDMGIIFFNPCGNIKLPKKENKKISPLTLNEQQSLENAALNSKHGAGIILALYTGMRIGEVCALTWDNVDFKNAVITVSGTLQRIPGSSGNNTGKTQLSFGKPKNTSSERIIPMSFRLSTYLTSLKKHSTGEYVISNKNTCTEPRTLQNHFHNLLKKANIAPTSFHTLRHTFATRCMESSINVTTVSKLLGHASVKMTLDVYTDAVMEEKINAVNRLDNIYKNLNKIFYTGTLNANA